MHLNTTTRALVAATGTVLLVVAVAAFFVSIGNIDINPAAIALIATLSLIGGVFVWRWIAVERGVANRTQSLRPTWLTAATGFVTNFFDTLGIGSFATTTAFFKLRRVVADEQIPGTLNAGHALPTIVQAVVFIAAIQVAPVTLVAMIFAAVAGARLGAGIVAGLPRRAIQIGMGVALLAAGILFTMKNLALFPKGGEAMELQGALLLVGVVANFFLGALMTVGVGLYAPCMILVSLLGMPPGAAWPIMTGSCAFLMPVAGLKFIGSGRYGVGATIGLALGGIPAVLLAAPLVKKLLVDEQYITWLRWLVILVVLYSAIAMLLSAAREQAPARSPVTP